MELGAIIGGVTACVSIGTLAFVAYRERRESNARAEQRAKAIIDLLRIAANEAEPKAVREFARSELRRMRAELTNDADHDSMIDRVFGNRPLDEANARLVEAETGDTTEMDPDVKRLVTIVQWWSHTSGLIPAQQRSIRISLVAGLMVLGFLTLLIGAVRATGGIQ